MKHRFRRCALLAAFAALSMAQVPMEPEPQSGGLKLPDGSALHEPPPIRMPRKSPSERMLKAELAANLTDAAQLVDLAGQLHGDLEKNGRYVFSIADCKKAEEIEKLAHKIRTRMQHN